MIYSVHQPHYLPYPGYLTKVQRSDVFVFLEKVQYVKREFMNRNRIKGPQGAFWLTVPVKGEYKAKINEMRIDESVNWREKHIRTLERCYPKSPCPEEIEHFAKVIQPAYKNLAELLMSTTEHFIHTFGIKTPLHRQEEYGDLPEDPNRRIIEIGRSLGADTYLAGSGGRNYMDIGAFEKAGITVKFMEYQPCEYPQYHGDFVPNLAAIDLLLNHGYEGFLRFCNSE